MDTTRLPVHDSQEVLTEVHAAPTRALIENMCATTVGNIGISATNLKTISIPVSSLQERRRAVEMVEFLMALCDDLEAKLTQQHTDADRQAVEIRELRQHAAKVAESWRHYLRGL